MVGKGLETISKHLEMTPIESKSYHFTVLTCMRLQLGYTVVHPQTQASPELTLWLYIHGQTHSVGKLEYLLLKIHLLQHSLAGILLITYSRFSLFQHPLASTRKRKYPFPGEELGTMCSRVHQSSEQLQFGLLSQQCGSEVLKNSCCISAIKDMQTLVSSLQSMKI